MPTYDYECETCGHREDYIHPAGDRLKVTCSCGGRMEWCFPTPTLWTDTEFCAGRGDGQGNGFYSHQLNRRVTSRDDIRKTCEKEGWGCEGAVNVKKREPLLDPRDKPYEVAPDIVEDHVSAEVAQKHNGQVSLKKYKELTEKHTHELSGRDA